MKWSPFCSVSLLLKLGAFVFSVVETECIIVDKHFQNLVFFPYFNTESVANLGIRECDLRCSEMFKRFSLDNLKNTANGKLEK